MPYTMAEFNTGKQSQYKTAVAAAASVPISRVIIVDITEARRRAGGVKVGTRIHASDSAGVDSLVSSLGTGDALIDNINTELEENGLSESTGITAQTLASTDVGPFSSSSTSLPSLSLLPMIIGASVGAVLIMAMAVFCIRRRRAASKISQVLPVYQQGQKLYPAADKAQTSSALILEDVDDGLPEDFKELIPNSPITRADLELSASAQTLKNTMFENTFLSDASSAMLDGILSVGQSTPVIGVLFGLLSDLKKMYDTYVETDEDCKRWQVWCVGQISTLGFLAKEVHIDSDTDKLLRQAIWPLLGLKQSLMKRQEDSKGVVGKAMASLTSREYKSAMEHAQKHVQAAIDALSLRVQVNTQREVQQVLKKMNLLLNMDQKLDVLLSMAENNNKKFDQVLGIAELHTRQSVKQTIKETVLGRKLSAIDRYNIMSSACHKEVEPFARGASSAVYRAKWNRQTVAVKTLSLNNMTRSEREKLWTSFMGEVDILVRLRHPNILTVFGVIDDDASLLQLVTEYASRGELGEFLRESDQSLPQSQQVDFCLQMAMGLNYLHSQRIAHRDYKSLNVLVSTNSDGEWLLKISDFGLSKEETGATLSTVTAFGTPAWSAPEILRQTPQPDYYLADIWSYGVVVWEVATRSIPFEGMNMLQIMFAAGVEGMRMTLSDHALADVVDGCCQAEPQNRLLVGAALALLLLYGTSPICQETNLKLSCFQDGP